MPTIPNARLAAALLFELGPILAMMFLGLTADRGAAVLGMWLSLAIACTLSLALHQKLPVLPVLLAACTLATGVATLITGDPIWVQQAVPIAAGTFALLLVMSLTAGRNLLKVMFGRCVLLTPGAWDNLASVVIGGIALGSLVRALVELRAPL